MKTVHYIQCPLYQPQSNIKTLITGNLLFYRVSQHYCSAYEQQKAKFKNFHKSNNLKSSLHSPG